MKKILLVGILLFSTTVIKADKEKALERISLLNEAFNLATEFQNTTLLTADVEKTYKIKKRQKEILEEILKINEKENVIKEDRKEMVEKKLIEIKENVKVYEVLFD